MNRKMKWALWTGALCLCVAQAFAADPQYDVLGKINSNGIFDPSVADISLKYLRLIFGTVGNALTGSSNQLMGELFGIFNVGMLVFTGAFVSYTVVTSIVSSAQDGSPMGNKMSAWIPFRIVLGTSMMIPMSGYSGAQILVMWAVVQGVGLADHVWERAVKYIAQIGGNAFQMQQLASSGSSGNTTTLDDQFTDLNTLLGNTYRAAAQKPNMANLYASAFCLAANQENVRRNNTKDTFMVRRGKACNVTNHSQFGANGEHVVCLGSKERPRRCGAFTINISDAVKVNTGSPNASSDNTQIEKLAKGYTMMATERALTSLVSSAQQWLEDALHAKDGKYEKTLTCPTYDSNGLYMPYCQPANALVAAATTYLTTIKPARTTIAMIKKSVTADASQRSARAKVRAWRQATMAQGWMSAASAYRNLNTSDFTNPPKNEPIGDFLLKTMYAPRTIQTSNADINKISNRIIRDNGGHLRPYQVRARKVVSKLKEAFYNKNASVQAYATNTLDKVTQQMIGVLMNFNISNGPFNDKSFGLPLTVAQENLVTLIRNVLGSMVGLGIYGTPPHALSVQKLYNIYDSGPPDASGQCKNVQNNPACKSQDGSGCFQAALTSQCVVKGHGLLGMLASTNEGKPVDPVGAMWRLGTTMIDNAVGYWIYTMETVYKTIKHLLLYYSLAMIGTNVIGGLLQGIATGADQGWAAGLMAGITNGATIVFKLNYQFDSQSLMLYMPFGAMVALVFFTIGIMLAVYIPFIPFLMFTFAAIGWIVAVIEAMVAAPLVALGVTHPEGHDLLGKAEQSAILLLGVFIRPVAILIGFLASIYLVNVAMMLLNSGFLHMIANYMAQSSDTQNAPFIKIIGASGVLVVYVYAAMAVVNQAFSLIFQVPERVLRWIGGPQEQSMVGQMMQEIKGGVRDAGGQAGQAAASRVGQGPGNYAPEAGSSKDSKDEGTKMGKKLKARKSTGSARGAGEDGPGGGGAPGGGGGESQSGSGEGGGGSAESGGGAGGGGAGGGSETGGGA